MPARPPSSKATSPAPADAADGAAAPRSFEQAVSELEALVQNIENGSLSLEASLAAYRRGAQLLAYCRRTLDDARQQVRILEGDLLEPFDAERDTAE